MPMFMCHDHCFMFIILKIKDWQTCEGRISGVCFQHHGQKFFCEKLARGRARSKHGGMLVVDFRQPSHLFTFYVGINLIFTLTILTPIICYVRTRARFLEFVVYTGIKSLNEDFRVKFIKGFTRWSWTSGQVKIQDEHDSKQAKD